MKTIALSKRKSFYLALFSTITIFSGISLYPALAQDPFRTKDVRDIGKYTEAAFEEIFKAGNYPQVGRYLASAEAEEPNEPLAHAIRASLAYTEKDWETLNNYGLQTIRSATDLVATDPLRGNLYLAVGHFLEGTYIYEKQGAIPAINKLQLVFDYLDKAEDIAPNDPELNLIKGYMDLLLAVNLPFSSPEQAIARFERYAAPNYLVDRGLAVAYRDLKQYDKALVSVDRSLKLTPDNPEVLYLKGQILRQMGKKHKNINTLQEALNYFDRALARAEMLPQYVLKTLEREHRQTLEKIDEINSSAANL